MQPKGDFQFWFFFDIINSSYSLNQLEKVCLQTALEENSINPQHGDW